MLQPTDAQLATVFGQANQTPVSAAADGIDGAVPKGEEVCEQSQDNHADGGWANETESLTIALLNYLGYSRVQDRIAAEYSMRVMNWKAPGLN